MSDMSMLENCKIQLQGLKVNDRLIQMYISRYALMACAESGFDRANMPEIFEPYIETAAIQAVYRTGDEGVTSRGALGISNSYTDIEKGLKDAVKGKRNPFSVVPGNGGEL